MNFLPPEQQYDNIQGIAGYKRKRTGNRDAGHLKTKGISYTDTPDRFVPGSACPGDDTVACECIIKRAGQIISGSGLFSKIVFTAGINVGLGLVLSGYIRRGVCQCAEHFNRYMVYGHLHRQVSRAALPEDVDGVIVVAATGLIMRRCFAGP